jgi:hypothetical protein
MDELRTQQQEARDREYRDRALELAVAYSAAHPDIPSYAVTQAAEKFERYLRTGQATNS